MRKSLWVVLLIASLVVATTIALIFGMKANHLSRQGENIDSGDSVVVEGSEYPFKLTMIVEKTELNISEALYMNFTLENIGDQDLTMYFVDGSDRFLFAIYNESDAKSVYTHSVGYPQDHIPEVLRPHETRVKEWGWRQIGDLVYVGLDKDPPYYFKTIVPGKYYIVGMFESSTLNLLIQTPSVSFTISG